MPQLDQFPILFQFKSFIFSFGLLYLVFLFFIIPVLHGSMKSRKIFINFIDAVISLSLLYSSRLNVFLVDKFKSLNLVESSYFKHFESIYSGSVFLKFFSKKI